MNIDTCNIFEVESDDVDVSSFKVRDELNPYIWDEDGNIDEDVRDKLLDVADDFIDTLEIPWVKIKDVVLTGSIANYNWSEYSDIDIHIVLEFKDVWEKRQDFVKDYFDAKKNEWQDVHESIEIYGFPVEISVENASDPVKSSGVYSLKYDEWVKEPKDLSDARLNIEYVKDTAAKNMTEIDDIIKKTEKTHDPQKRWKCAEKLISVFERLKKLRKSGLSSDAKEMSSGNIVWKVMRREGYLDKLWDTVNSAYDDSKSIRRKGNRH